MYKIKKLCMLISALILPGLSYAICFDVDKKYMVSQKGWSSNWAGRVVKMCGDRNNNSGSSSYKIEIQWITDRSTYKCGQIITKSPDQVQDFETRSYALKECN